MLRVTLCFVLVAALANAKCSFAPPADGSPAPTKNDFARAAGVVLSGTVTSVSRTDPTDVHCNKGCSATVEVTGVRKGCVNRAVVTITGFTNGALCGRSLPAVGASVADLYLCQTSGAEFSLMRQAPGVGASAEWDVEFATPYGVADVCTAVLQECSAVEPTGIWCSGGAPVVNCLVDPCQGATCAAFPAATCHSNYCGGCNRRWYDEASRKDVTAECNVVTRTLPTKPTTTTTTTTAATTTTTAATTKPSLSGACCDRATEPGRFGLTRPREAPACCDGTWVPSTGGSSQSTCGTKPVGPRCAPSCSATTVYDGCNTCSCTSAGVSICTQRACEPSVCRRHGVEATTWSDADRCVSCTCDDAATNTWSCSVDRANCIVPVRKVLHFFRLLNLRGVTIDVLELILSRFVRPIKVVSADAVSGGGLDVVLSVEATASTARESDTADEEAETYMQQQIASEGGSATVERMGSTTRQTTSGATAPVLGALAAAAALALF